MNVPPDWKIRSRAKTPYEAIQATCVAKGGKVQYIYHPLWVILRDILKFERIMNLAIKLRDYKPDRSEASKVLWLMINTCVRTGNLGSPNDHRGMVSLRRENVVISKSGRMHLSFTGKSGIAHNIHVREAKCRHFLEARLQLPGKKSDKLFGVSADGLNKLVKEKLGKSFTCKDIRTCQANIRMVEVLCESGCRKSGLTPKAAVAKASAESALLLGHTVAISKKNYVCSGIATSYLKNPKQFHRTRNYGAVLKRCLREYLAEG